MKRKIKLDLGGGKVKEKELNYIPFRYIVAFLITIFEVLAIIGIVVALCIFVPYFYRAIGITTFLTVVKIIASDDNPDYKIPWLLFVVILPVVGLMLYFIFSSRKLKKKYIKRLDSLKTQTYDKEKFNSLDDLEKQNVLIASQAKMLCDIAETSVFKNTKTKYFNCGEDYHQNLLEDLRNAKHFVYMEYFIIEEGKFWNSILDILKEKASQGLEVKVVFDDIGCMSTLPGNYAKILKKFGIEATPFSRLKGAADNEFNNRNHRKITVIDGTIAYTGGVNIADEYINVVEKYGHWKDSGIRIEGTAVFELTRLFLIDFGINVKKMPVIKNENYPAVEEEKQNGFVVPFGDGPKPMYEHQVGKSVIQNLLTSATKYAFITTPYLIVDNDLCQTLENTALRGVDVRIIVPHIPDKKIVFNMTRSYYNRLTNSGVKIFEYTPGFIHSKTILIDDCLAMVGTINLDYRSLVHHFENGILLYECDCLKDIKADFEDTLEKSKMVKKEDLKTSLLNKFFRSLVRIFAPLL